MKKNGLPVLIALAAVSVLAGCRKDPVENLTGDEGRIYVTKHDESFSFNSYNTFSIADSVAVISDNRLEGRAVTDVDLAYINAVKAQLQQRGFTLVARDQNPDVGITVSRIYNTSTGVIDYGGGYWGGGYGSYWDPWYWGYPGGGYYFPPSYYGVYSITEGAVSIDAFDLKSAHQNNQIRGVWNGLVRGSGTFAARNAEGAVKALFDQSDYFKAQ